MGLLDSLNEKTKQAEKRQTQDDERAKTRFRHRLAAQQFLKHHAPLFPAYIRAGGASTRIADHGVFADKAKLARNLAVAIAAHVLEKPVESVNMQEARHFRVEAAEIVAGAWEAEIEIDVDLMARDIAATVKGADDVYDAETIAWAQMSGLGSATLTAAAAAASLTMAIELYDFRLGHAMVLSTLTAAVLHATREGVETILPLDATDEDRRSLSQTTLRTNCAILKQIYETAAREAVSTLHRADEEEKRAWLRQSRPLDTIVAKFRSWSHDIATIAAAAARETVVGLGASNGAGPSH